MTRIGVIGAGPAGLSAALTAAERGHDVVVFEAAETVGGMSGSFEVAGLRVDFGSHRLHASAAPMFQRRLQTLLGSDLQARQRHGRIRLRDRWVAFPFRLSNLVRRLPVDFGARVAVETVTGAVPIPFGDRNESGGGFLDEVSRRLGPTVTREFYEPYATKLYGVDPRQLTAELARRRVSAASPLRVVAAALGAGTTGGRTFYYPRRGYGQVSEALAEAAVAAGAELRLGEAVNRVVSGTEPVVTTTGSSVAVDLVASTAPLPRLVGALDPAPDQAVVAAVSALRTRAMVLVYLVVSQPRYTPFDAHYFPSLDVSISRLSEPKNYRDGDDPADVTVLCAEVPCWVGDRIWSMAGNDLAGLVVDDLARTGLPRIRVDEVVVRRLPAVYPVYEVATEWARDRVAAWLAHIPGVLSFGRQGLGVPDNIHHVIDMGRIAASDLGPQGVDRDRWQKSLQRFATNVVVD